MTKLYLKNCVKECPRENDNESYASGKFSIIVTDNEKREKINHEKLEQLLPNEKTFYANAEDKSANVPNAPIVSEQLSISETGQLPTKLIIKPGAPVMITANHTQKKHKDNGLVNGARGYVDSIQPSAEDPEVAEVIWVRFCNDNVGQLLRYTSGHLYENHKPNDKLAVPIVRQRKSFTVKQGNTKYVRYQFPLTLCYAITCHKSQGQTLEDVLIDFIDGKGISAGSFYTALTRVKHGRNLFLKDFKIDYIITRLEVEKKIGAMIGTKQHIFKKIQNDQQIFDNSSEEIKIGYININDLMTSRSSEFINKDQNILALDYLAIADTRLSQNMNQEELQQQLSNWTIITRFDANDHLKHMGLLILKSKHTKNKNNVENIEKKEIRVKENILCTQLINIFFEDGLKASFLYSRENPSNNQIQEITLKINDMDLVMGDINLDPKRTDDAPKLLSMCDNRSRVLNEVTTIRYNQLDHIFLNSEKYPSYFTTTFFNHSSDHYLICIRLSKKKTNFTENHLKKTLFSSEKCTKSIVKKRISSNKNTSENSSQTSAINLSSLISPNWLDDEVMNKYLELLSNFNKEIFAFSTFFYVAFKQGGFRRVKNWYKNHDITQYQKIFIPINYKGNHWILCVYDGNCLSCYEPDIIIGKASTKQIKLTETKEREYTKFLTNLLNNYIKPFFKPTSEIVISLNFPPKIPIQENSSDCGVFCLMFARYITLEKQFDFKTSDMIMFRDLIRLELQSNSIILEDLNDEMSPSEN